VDEMDKKNDITINDLIDKEEEFKGQTFTITGFLGLHKISDNFTRPEKIVIYGHNGSYIEFEYSRNNLPAVDSIRFSLDLISNQQQEVHAKVFICEHTGKYIINNLQVHKHPIGQDNSRHEHNTYIL
jgi:hypothetical protein